MNHHVKVVDVLDNDDDVRVEDADAIEVKAAEAIAVRLQ